MKKEVIPVKGLFKRPHYSHVIKAGNTIYVSGQVAVDENGNIVGTGDFRIQAEKVFENLQLALKAAEASLDDVVNITAFISSSAGSTQDVIPVFREIAIKYFGTESPPASTWVVPSSLAAPEYLVEVSAIAVAEG